MTSLYLPVLFIPVNTQTLRILTEEISESNRIGDNCLYISAYVYTRIVSSIWMNEQNFSSSTTGFEVVRFW